MGMDMKQDANEQDYTATSLAAAAGVHFTYIARLCRQGKLACRKLGQYWLISREDGQRWLEERQAKQAQ